MKNIKHELQHIILSNEPVSEGNSIKKIQNFLRRYAQTSFNAKKSQFFKSEEATVIIDLMASKTFLIMTMLMTNWV